MTPVRYLLDINVLIALFDPDHVFHHRAHLWWADAPRAWASCPLTENGLVRIMCSASYSKAVAFTIADITARLSQFAKQTDHAFWPDSLTLRNSSTFHPAQILGARQLTDIYLLALAVSHAGCLATFDEQISLNAVIGAADRHLKVL